MGRYFGVPDDEAFAAIASYKPSNQRSQLLVSGTNTLVVDAYNANPSSMDAALRNIAAMECGSGLDSKLVMLGEMRELGADSLREHIKILRLLESLGLVYRLVGNEFGSALDAEKISRDGCWFPDSETLASALAQAPVSHSLILLKGSRGTRMEKVLNSL